MNEIIFLIEEDPKGGYTARCMQSEFSLFTEGDSIPELKNNIMNSLQCHFDGEEKIPKLIKSHKTFLRRL